MIGLLVVLSAFIMCALNVIRQLQLLLFTSFPACLDLQVNVGAVYTLAAANVNEGVLAECGPSHK